MTSTTHAKPLEPPARSPRVFVIRRSTVYLGAILIAVLFLAIGFHLFTLQQLAEVVADKTVEIVLALLVIRFGGRL